MLTIYTDGSCIGNPGPGGWAYLIESDTPGFDQNGGPLENSGREASTTNNRMELMACIEALETVKTLVAAAPNPSLHSACLRTDSRYIVDGLSSWLPNWKRNNWKTATKTPVKNMDLWIRLDALVGSSPIRIGFEWVKAHSGIAGNERVDQLAKIQSNKLIV